MSIQIYTFEYDRSPLLYADDVPRWVRIPKLELEQMLEHASYKLTSDKFRNVLLAYLRAVYTPNVDAAAILFMPDPPRKWAQLLAYSELRQSDETRNQITVVSGPQLERFCGRSIVIEPDGPAYLELRQWKKIAAKLL